MRIPKTPYGDHYNLPLFQPGCKISKIIFTYKQFHAYDTETETRNQANADQNKPTNLVFEHNEIYSFFPIYCN